MSELTRNIKSVEQSTIVEVVSATTREVRVLPVPRSEETSKSAKAVDAKPMVIILQELPPVVPEPAVPSPPENVLSLT